MPNINKIRLSGQTYTVQDPDATKTVELTQAEYDELSQKDPNVFYIITDAKGADLSNYYTSAQTESAINQAVSGKVDTSTFNTYSGSVDTALNAKADTATTYTKTEVDNAITAATSTKQDTLVSGTNIKTINNESILGEGNITIQGGGGGGGSITVDQTLDSGSTNPVANSAITTSVNEKQFKRRYVGCDNGDIVFGDSDSVIVDGKSVKIMYPMFRGYSNNSTNTGLELKNVDLGLYFTTINGKNIFNTSKNANWITEVIETSAITTSVTSESTDSQVPSAKCVYDQLGGMKIVKLNQSDYDSLTTKDDNTLYFVGDSNGYTMKIGSANVN